LEEKLQIFISTSKGFLKKNEIRVDLGKKRFKAGKIFGASKPTDIKRQEVHNVTWEIGKPALRAEVEGVETPSVALRIRAREVTRGR
jgi:hypothetical protein